MKLSLGFARTDGYNKYMKLVRDATWPCAALQRGNKIYPIGDDNPLLHFLSGKTHVA